MQGIEAETLAGGGGGPAAMVVVRMLKMSSMTRTMSRTIMVSQDRMRCHRTSGDYDYDDDDGDDNTHGDDDEDDDDEEEKTLRRCRKGLLLLLDAKAS